MLRRQAAEAVQLEELSGGSVAQDFTMHVVDVARDRITVLLSYVPHALAFWKVTADKAVGVLIGAPFTRGIGVAVIEAGDQGLYAVCVLELGAIIHSDALEGAAGEAAHDFGKGGDRGGGGLGGNSEDDFKAGLPLREDQEGLVFASGLANHAVHLPMAEGGTGFHNEGAALNAGAFGGPGGFDLLVLALLLFGFLPEVLICNIGNIALIYVTVEGGRGDSPLIPSS